MKLGGHNQTLYQLQKAFYERNRTKGIYRVIHRRQHIKKAYNYRNIIITVLIFYHHLHEDFFFHERNYDTHKFKNSYSKHEYEYAHE